MFIETYLEIYKKRKNVCSRENKNFSRGKINKQSNIKDAKARFVFKGENGLQKQL